MTLKDTFALSSGTAHYAQHWNGVVKKTDPNPRQQRSIGQREHGSKPRRGGLFIATDNLKLSFLFFGCAAYAEPTPVRMPAADHTRNAQIFAAPRSRKTKKKNVVCVHDYKQATPTGFV